MIGCPLCGSGDTPPQTVKWGRLSATRNPDALCWDGARIRGSYPAHGRLLWPLIRLASSGERDVKMGTRDLAMMLRDEAEDNAVGVHVYRLRHVLQLAGLPVRIETVPRWGYRLVVEEGA